MDTRSKIEAMKSKFRKAMISAAIMTGAGAPSSVNAQSMRISSSDRMTYIQTNTRGRDLNVTSQHSFQTNRTPTHTYTVNSRENGSVRVDNKGGVSVRTKQGSYTRNRNGYTSVRVNGGNNGSVRVDNRGGVSVRTKNVSYTRNRNGNTSLRLNFSRGR